MSKRKDIMKHILENRGIIKKTINIYNKLCPECRKKLMVYSQRNMELPYNKMCPTCKEMAQEEYKEWT